MAEGDVLPPDESWYRVLIREEYVADGARISEAALKSGAISPNTNTKRAWSHEVSGRRSSMCGSPKEIDDHGVQFVQNIQQRRKKQNPDIKYVGVAYATAGALDGEAAPGVKTSVVHTPINPDDVAHADFAIFNATNDHLDEVRTFLQDRLIVSRPGSSHPFAAVSSGTMIVLPPTG